MKLMDSKDIATSIMKSKKMCAHGGPMKCAMGCYAEGGMVDEDEDFLSSEGDQNDELADTDDLFSFPIEDEDEADKDAKKKALLRRALAKSKA